MKFYNHITSSVLFASLASSSLVDLVFRATPTPVYNVYPKNRTDIGYEERINSTLKGYGVDLNKLYFSKSTLPELGVFYWEAPITSDQASQLNKSSDVAGVYASCKNTNKCTDPTTSGDFTSGNFTELPSRVINKRDDGLTQQEPLPAKDEMVFISQASSAPLNSLGGKYVYDKSAGKDAIVYVVDTGAFLDNKDFTNGANVKAKTTWIYARPDLAGRPEDFNQGHGTCMLSKVTGDQYGVSKNVSPIVVKVPSVVERGNGNLDWIEGVKKAYEDYKAKLDTPPRLDEKVGAIISMSIQIQSTGPSALDPPAVDYFRVILQALVSVGVLPITGAGNGANMPIDGYPASFAGGTTPDVPELMVIGNCNNDGSRYLGSQMAPYVTVYAPGVRVTCAANPDLGGDTRTGTGTSESAASVAGLAAYFKKLTSLAHTLKMDDDTVLPRVRVQALKDYIENQSSYRRNSPNNPKSFYNNVDSRNYQPATIPPPPPYNLGTCHIHVNELWLCAGNNDNLLVEVTMWDNAGKQIGYVKPTEAGSLSPLSMTSKLENSLVVVPEHQNDYISFSLGAQAWPSSQDQKTNPQTYCNVGGWDPRQGPNCGRFGSPARRQMDCYFVCHYGGGKSSDGS